MKEPKSERAKEGIPNPALEESERARYAECDGKCLNVHTPCNGKCLASNLKVCDDMCIPVDDKFFQLCDGKCIPADEACKGK